MRTDCIYIYVPVAPLEVSRVFGGLRPVAYEWVNFWSKNVDFWPNSGSFGPFLTCISRNTCFSRNAYAHMSSRRHLQASCKSDRLPGVNSFREKTIFQILGTPLISRITCFSRKAEYIFYIFFVCSFFLHYGDSK